MGNERFLNITNVQFSESSNTTNLSKRYALILAQRQAKYLG